MLHESFLYAVFDTETQLFYTGKIYNGDSSTFQSLNTDRLYNSERTAKGVTTRLNKRYDSTNMARYIVVPIKLTATTL